MMFLVSGASGVGKSTVGAHLSTVLPPDVVCVELADVLLPPPHPDTAYRQRAARAAVLLALGLQGEGRHVVLASDPVAVGELLAVPEADGLDGIAVCLLDATEAVQRERLAERRESEEALGHHAAFARWMRAHVVDPQHMQHVLIDGGVEHMRWDRWTGLRRGDAAWGVHVIDTSSRDAASVGAAVEEWIGDALAGRAPVFTGEWLRGAGSVPASLDRVRDQAR